MDNSVSPHASPATVQTFALIVHAGELKRNKNAHSERRDTPVIELARLQWARCGPSTMVGVLQGFFRFNRIISCTLES